MNCPLHEDQFLFLNGYKSHGWCPVCKKWYCEDEIDEDDEDYKGD